MEKDKGGRPTKLTKDWLKAAEKIVNDDINAIILTDEELVMEINDLVVEKARITDRTFQNWKAKSKDPDVLDELGRRFFRLIKKALIKQRKNLFKKFRQEPNQWQRWAWILERKFDEWNIRHLADVTTGGQPITGINIVAPKGVEESDGTNPEPDTKAV